MQADPALLVLVTAALKNGYRTAAAIAYLLKASMCNVEFVLLELARQSKVLTSNTDTTVPCYTLQKPHPPATSKRKIVGNVALLHGRRNTRLAAMCTRTSTHSRIARRHRRAKPPRK